MQLSGTRVKATIDTLLPEGGRERGGGREGGREGEGEGRRVGGLSFKPSILYLTTIQLSCSPQSYNNVEVKRKVYSVV